MALLVVGGSIGIIAFIFMIPFYYQFSIMIVDSIILSYVFKSVNDYINLKVLIAGSFLSICILLISLLDLDIPKLYFDSDFLYFLTIWILAAIVTSLIWWIWFDNEK